MVAALRLSQFHAELRRLAQVQDGLRLDVQRGREASLLGLSEATQALQGQIGHAQRALAEVKALEQGRTWQLDYATDALRRLEAVVAGSSTRRAAGESILARTLGQLPPDLLALTTRRFGSRVVEYALRLPDGRYLPIDSKWTSVASLEALELADDLGEKRRLAEQVGATCARGSARCRATSTPNAPSPWPCSRCPTPSIRPPPRCAARDGARGCSWCRTRWPWPSSSWSTG